MPSYWRETDEALLVDVVHHEAYLVDVGCVHHPWSVAAADGGLSQPDHIAKPISPDAITDRLQFGRHDILSFIFESRDARDFAECLQKVHHDHPFLGSGRYGRAPTVALHVKPGY